MSKKPIHDRLRWFVHILVAGWLLLAVPAVGQGAGRDLLSEAEFLATLDAHHPAVVALADRLARAEGDLRRAGTLRNPTFEFEYEAPSDEVDQSMFKLGWQPPLDGRRGLAVDAGEMAVEAAGHDLEWTRLEVRQELRAVFAEWAVAERRRALVAQHHESLQGLSKRLDVRAERGEESQLAASRFALAVMEVRTRLALSEADLARVRGRALALNDDLSPTATPLLPDPPAVLDALDGAIVRPDLLARRSEVEAATLERRLAGRVLEFPTLVAGWTRIGGADQDFDGLYFGVAWDVPLFDRNQGDRYETTRAIAVAEARLRLTERDAAQRRAAALAAYTALTGSLSEVAGVIENASALVQAASASFLAGESSMTDLLETQRSVLEGELAALDLQAQALAAHRELELSVGHVLTEGELR